LDLRTTAKESFSVNEIIVGKNKVEITNNYDILSVTDIRTNKLVNEFVGRKFEGQLPSFPFRAINGPQGKLMIQHAELGRIGAYACNLCDSCFPSLKIREHH